MSTLMRRFELILTAVVVFAVFWPVLNARRLRRGRVAVLLAVALLLQIVVEGYRWQLLPLYLTAAGLAVGDVLWEDRRFKGVPRLRRGALGVLGVGLVGVLPVALPVPVIPPPSGPYQVGTATFVIVEQGHEEAYGPTPGSPRRIVVQAWYPAKVAEGARPEPWATDFDVVGPALSRHLGLPGFFLDQANGVPSHSYTDASPYSGKIPVVVYSHGWGGFRTIALNQEESLASHGFLVLAPDHTYGAVATRFPDGTVAYLDPAALPDEAKVGTSDYEKAAQQLVATFAGDLEAILDALGEGSSGPFGPLADHADLNEVGLYGHSTGGGAVIRVCLEDDRCKAVLGMDPWVEPIPDRIVAKELQVPSLFMRSDGWRGTPNDGRLRGLAERSPSTSYWMGIEGAGHNDFVMAPLLSPFAHQLGLTGPMPSDQVLPIIDRYLVAFFDRYLYGASGLGLDRPPPAGVDLEVLP